MQKIKWIFSVVSFIIIAACSFLNQKENKEETTTNYLNHSDSAKYVGIETCRQCHENIYQTFVETGMGKSIDVASKQKSSGDFKKKIDVFDSHNKLSYSPFWKGENLFIREVYRGLDQDFIREEKVSFIIGSGQHTNSHLSMENGYVHQMPLTFYAQSKKWDLPPGFENGQNSRFSRNIGIECMSCHNSFPEKVEGSENKYTHIPNGINCERCHGPGSIHVAEKRKGIIVDTSKYIDYTIVNPAKLNIDLQFDICQRCHLQGNTVLKKGSGYFDFKPGMKLSDYMSIFLPKYQNADKDFIMASHADRLKMSRCFTESAKKVNSKELKPFKNALTCITCHNPHISVRETNPDVFNQSCRNCHNANKEKHCSDSEKNLVAKNNDCSSCHMPVSGSTDIPHVTVHDHWIRKPEKSDKNSKEKIFKGLFAINEQNPEKIYKMLAYIQQFEKFEKKQEYLDSASFWYAALSNETKQKELNKVIYFHFVKNEYNTLIELIESNKKNSPQNLFNKVNQTNDDAWSSYRVAESYSAMGKENKALDFYKNAVLLAPYVLEFRNKLAVCYVKLLKLNEAENELKFILSENNKNEMALCNMGYVYELKNDLEKAEKTYIKAIKMNPVYELAWINLAGLYLKTNRKRDAKNAILQILKINPQNTMARNIILTL